MPCRFLVVCESEADFRMVTRLVERVVCECVDYVDDDLLRSCPIWFGLDQNTPFLKWTEIKNVSARENIPAVRGEFSGRSGEYDARNAIRVFRLFKRWQFKKQQIDGILLVRDHDGLPGRYDWLIKARESEVEIGDLVVIGIARHERESWALTGFSPLNMREEKSVATLRVELGFDPCTGSHHLTAKKDDGGYSAKRVLDLLTEKNYEREEICWGQTPLATLRERGEASGLSAFLSEVEDRLAPLFTKRPPERDRHPD